MKNRMILETSKNSDGPGNHNEEIELETISIIGQQERYKKETEKNEAIYYFEKPFISAETWWSVNNLIRLSCWISIWWSCYFFMDAIKMTGHRMNPPPPTFVQEGVSDKIDPRSPGFPLLIVVIFGLAMLWNGIVMVINSNLDLGAKSKKALTEYFKAIMAFTLWALSEVFLVIIAIIYLEYANNSLKPTDWLVLLRLLIIPIALFRAHQVIKAERALAKSLITG